MAGPTNPQKIIIATFVQLMTENESDNWSLF